MGYVGTHADHHRRRRRRGHERGHAAASAARARGHHGRRAQRVRLVRQLRPALPRGRRHRGALRRCCCRRPRPSTQRFDLDVRVHHEAVRIDRDRHVLVVRDLVAGELVELPYDALVLSTGARAVRPPIPGIERALSLRDVEDTDALVAATVGARTAVVVGGGFIGVEVTENLVHLGLDVTLVEATDQVMAPLDPEMATPVHDRIREHGVDGCGSGPASPPSARTPSTLTNGETVPADLVVAAIGVRPDTTLAQQAGLAVGERGGILVDDAAAHLRPRRVRGRRRRREDRRRRRLADAGAAGQHRQPAGPAGGRRHRRAGRARPPGARHRDRRGLRAPGRHHRLVREAAARRGPLLPRHPHPSGVARHLLPRRRRDGPEAARRPRRPTRSSAPRASASRGVDKRIDVIATAITGGLTASALAELELAYAPAFSLGQGPGQHARPRRRQPAAGHQCVGAVARARGCRGQRCGRRRRARHGRAHRCRRHPRGDPPAAELAARAARRDPGRAGRRALRRRRARAHRGPDPRPARSRRAQPRRRDAHLAGRHPLLAEHRRAAASSPVPDARAVRRRRACGTARPCRGPAGPHRARRGPAAAPARRRPAARPRWR